jgi:abhydrolase domain-containing protein 12
MRYILRALPYRTELCSNLAKRGYHVFAIDCRGYGDSTGSPTEQGVVHDLIQLWQFIKDYNKLVKLILYGHSLGTG